MVIVGDQAVAEKVVHLNSLTKSPTYSDNLPVIGKHSIITLEGEEWKKVRRLFNPAFSTRHLETLLGPILEEINIFIDRLRQFAKTNEVFTANEVVTNLTIDIIGR
jgi:cytochrome P450